MQTLIQHVIEHQIQYVWLFNQLTHTHLQKTKIRLSAFCLGNYPAENTLGEKQERDGRGLLEHKVSV